MTEQEFLDEFYSKTLYMSYSSLNKLIYSPSLFYRHYVLQQREDKVESYLIDGKVIHSLLLDNQSFDEQFILMPATLPTTSTRQVIDKIYELAEDKKDTLNEHDKEILQVLKDINLHQSLTDDKKDVNETGDVKRLKKILTDDACSYWKFLKVKGDKELIDSETLQRCSEAVKFIRQDSKACELLGLFTNEMQNVDIHNEKLFFAETVKSFGLKGVVDNIKIDHDNKKIYINDLKTTGKTISDFEETVSFYNYWAQAAIYYRLVAYNFHEILKEDWEIVFHFIVIDKYQQVYCFEVSTQTLNLWQEQLEEKLNEAEWHYKTMNYSLPFKFANQKVIL